MLLLAEVLTDGGGVTVTVAAVVAHASLVIVVVSGMVGVYWNTHNINKN